MTDIDDHHGGPLSPERTGFGTDLDWDHLVYRSCETGRCRVCGFLTHRPNGVWKHAPGDDELSRAATFLAIRAPA